MRALVVKGKNSSLLVVQAQLVALIEHAFCERLPFPRRVEHSTRASAHGSDGGDDDTTTDGDSSADAEAAAAASHASEGGEDDLWATAMNHGAPSKDPKFKMVTQRTVLQNLQELLQTYLVARIVQVNESSGAPNERTNQRGEDHRSIGAALLYAGDVVVEVRPRILLRNARCGSLTVSDDFR